MPPQVILLPKRARPFYGGHPWVYAGAIASIQGEPADGDEVELLSHAGHFIARGIYNSQSKIRVRLYSWSQSQSLDTDFFRSQLGQSVRLREDLGLYRSGGSTNACRLVSSEGDGLSGLTVDRYDRWLIVQFTSLGMARRREMWADLLMEQLHPEGIYIRTERGIGRLEGLELQDGNLRGEVPSGPVEIQENGLRFHAHLTEGQKTGFYLDQRDNRQAVAKFATGRRVLDAFCYTGGFGLFAARAGAREVFCVDVSEPALDLARANARLNDLPQVSFTRADVFEDLDQRCQAGEKFGLVVLDPPKFARSRNAIEEALRGYRRIQTLAIRLLEPGGFLATCCCSGLITMSMLDDLLAQLASEESRMVQILERRGPASDHPVSATCPESNYLKCIISRVI
jgi:23S rRNA (cytosine1962-C5)-methyltransferase